MDKRLEGGEELCIIIIRIIIVIKMNNNISNKN